MPSASLRKWMSERMVSLDEIENAHVMVGGSERGRRYATQQINQAYVMLLSSQFQGFCRDLHTECADFMVKSVSPAALQSLVLDALVRDRVLDKGNPNPGNIGSDFGRLGIRFWHSVYAVDARNQSRRALLDELNDWRNAIAHQDFFKVGNAGLRLQRVKQWRSACDGLSQSFDAAMRTHLQALLGMPPW